MFMIDKLLIEKKLRKIEEFLQELKTAKVKNFVEFGKDIVTKRFVERNLELAIEQMVDICKHFISGLDMREPETYAECFQILSEGKVIPKNTVHTFQAMVRFRNILIHGYNGIDDAITYKIYKNRLNDFRTFIHTVRDHIHSR
jgi:uncharacterized protein YutE (UPF0331/DUF86 family)